MASTANYLTYIMDQLSGLEGVRSRPMMGEYLLYYREKLFGGVYDDRLVVKNIPAARAVLPDAPEESPYPGAKPMLLVEEVDDRSLLTKLLQAMEPELPQPKPKRRKKA